MKKWLISGFICIMAIGVASAHGTAKSPIRADTSSDTLKIHCTLEVATGQETSGESVAVKSLEPTPKEKKIKLRKLKQKEIEKKPKESEIYRLAQLMYAENGSAKDDECVILTGIVVMKRVKSKAYPDTIEGVISQKGQYATYIEGSINCNPDERCMELSEEILRLGLADEYPDNLIFQAEFPQGKRVYKRFGQEYFCLA